MNHSDCAHKQTSVVLTSTDWIGKALYCNFFSDNLESILREILQEFHATFENLKVHFLPVIVQTLFSTLNFLFTVGSPIGLVYARLGQPFSVL